MELKIIHEDDNILVLDKPAGIIVFNEEGQGLIKEILKIRPGIKKVGQKPRHGIAHRLDKDTSGILLVAKSSKTLENIQEQFKKREIEKKYIALVVGNLEKSKGKIETLIGRSPKKRKKQKVFLPSEPSAKNKREAVTEYKVLKKFKKYTLIEARPRTGRKHQLRCHLAYLKHPIGGDKKYGFKDQPCPENLKRHFLHASYIKTKGGREFFSDLPEDLKEVIKIIEK